MTAINFTLALRLITAHEGCRCDVYLDTKRLLTIGIGYNIQARGWGPLERTIGRIIDKGHPFVTDEEAKRQALADILEIDRQLRTALPWYAHLDPVRQVALIDMGFMGVSKLLGFKRMLPAIRDGEFHTASLACRSSKWSTDVGPKRTYDVATMLELGHYPYWVTPASATEQALVAGLVANVQEASPWT